MGVRQSPKNKSHLHNFYNYNNFLDGGSTIENYAKKALNPNFVKPLSRTTKIKNLIKK
jgi:hypothetical protein